MVSGDSFVSSRPDFTTSREELFQRLILSPRGGYVEYDAEHGKGRRYHITISDLLEALWAFADEKEAAA